MKSKLNHLLVALCATAAVGSAHATDYYLGTVDQIGVVAGSNSVTGSFTDRLLFDIFAPIAFGAGTMQDSPVSVASMSILNIDNLQVDLYGPGNTFITSVGSGDNISGYGVLFAGTGYYFQVTGNANGLSGGQYAYAAFAQAVPEPETWAMLVAGLGLVGLQLRRRSGAGKIAIN